MFKATAQLARSAGRASLRRCTASPAVAAVRRPATVSRVPIGNPSGSVQSAAARAVMSHPPYSTQATTAVPTTDKNAAMFCFQCEQTRNGTGCTTIEGGVCGKTPEVAALQDLLMHLLKGTAMYASKTRALRTDALPIDKDIDVFIMKSTFATLTNVNFDGDRFKSYIGDALAVRETAKTEYIQACKTAGVAPESLEGPAAFAVADTSVQGLIATGKTVNIRDRRNELGEVTVGLQELIMYGLKGMCAYAEHADVLGQYDPKLGAFLNESLAFLSSKDALVVDKLLAMALRVGENNFRAMELLDAGGTGTYGHPIPTKVNVQPVAGKAILVSGHDLKDLEDILKQTEGKGVNVYTHGELLPAHSYPGLKKHKHLVGNYGSAWQLQKFEFSKFPGPILMTSNCLVEPREGYKNRIFTHGPVGWPGVRHIAGNDYSAIVKQALEMPGFTETKTPQEITIGFGRNAVLSVADKVIDAVKSGAIKHFFVIGGCDGAEGERSYYTKLAKSLPKDHVILTLGCGKYRFNKNDFGSIGGIPRLLDVGQCNDAYSAIQIAAALSKAFNVGLNELPISFAISWFEQKAVAVLLTMLHLGIKNIRLGPTLPAFVPAPVLDVLIKNYGIGGTNEPAKDFKVFANSL
eukprot:Opistho-2@9772